MASPQSNSDVVSSEVAASVAVSPHPAIASGTDSIAPSTSGTDSIASPPLFGGSLDGGDSMTYTVNSNESPVRMLPRDYKVGGDEERGERGDAVSQQVIQHSNGMDYEVCYVSEVDRALRMSEVMSVATIEASSKSDLPSSKSSSVAKKKYDERSDELRFTIVKN